MSDSYQAIYDAVRSKISGGNIGDAIRDVAFNAFDISWQKDAVKTEFLNVAYELQRPSTVYRPEISKDGNMWLAIYGDLPTGVVGAGKTPEKLQRKRWLISTRRGTRRPLSTEAAMRRLTEAQRRLCRVVNWNDGGLPLARMKPAARAMARRLQLNGILSKRNREVATLTEFGRSALTQSEDARKRGS